MSQGEGGQPQQQPLEVIIRGVIDWNENQIVTNQPEQPEISNLLRGGERGTMLPRITRATLMLADGGREFLTNISFTAMRSSTGTQTTTYGYTKVGP